MDHIREQYPKPTTHDKSTDLASVCEHLMKLMDNKEYTQATIFGAGICCALVNDTLIECPKWIVEPLALSLHEILNDNYKWDDVLQFRAALERLSHNYLEGVKLLMNVKNHKDQERLFWGIFMNFTIAYMYRTKLAQKLKKSFNIHPQDYLMQLDPKAYTKIEKILIPE